MPKLGVLLMHRSSTRAWLGILTLVALLGPWCPAAVAQKKEEAPLAVPIRGISGMAALDENEYLVVHDLKKDAGERLGVLHVHKKKAPSYQPVAVNWPKSGDATDLEALCAVPGRTNEYLACESGGAKSKEGRLFHLALHKDGGEWQAKVRKTIALPEDADNIEGIACLQAKGGDLIVILGER